MGDRLRQWLPCPRLHPQEPPPQERGVGTLVVFQGTEVQEAKAVLEAATSGRMSSLQAARLNVGRSGGDMAMLDGLHAH